MATIEDIMNGTPEGIKVIRYAMEKAREDQMKLVNEAMKERKGEDE